MTTSPFKIMKTHRFSLWLNPPRNKTSPKTDKMICWAKPIPILMSPNQSHQVQCRKISHSWSPIQIKVRIRAFLILVLLRISRMMKMMKIQKVAKIQPETLLATLTFPTTEIQSVQIQTPKTKKR